MNMIGSLRYHPSGRKRKTTALKTKRRAPVFVPYEPVQTLAQKQIDEFNAKYPSYSGPTTYQPKEDTSWKAEESKNFTVAPAYNKGAYQVVPRNEVEHIGR
jgi:hypothetical protein|tara:strand:+ start:534 stop:836 length:303 start_codon:yes stop_codon:yes gene_type:complete